MKMIATWFALKTQTLSVVPSLELVSTTLVSIQGPWFVPIYQQIVQVKVAMFLETNVNKSVLTVIRWIIVFQSASCSHIHKVNNQKQRNVTKIVQARCTVQQPALQTAQSEVAMTLRITVNRSVCKKQTIWTQSNAKQYATRSLLIWNSVQEMRNTLTIKAVIKTV